MFYEFPLLYIAVLFSVQCLAATSFSKNQRNGECRYLSYEDKVKPLLADLS